MAGQKGDGNGKSGRDTQPSKEETKKHYEREERKIGTEDDNKGGSKN